MSFENIKNSFLKNIYHIENDIFCIFDVKDYSPSEINNLTLKAREVVESGFLFLTSGTTSDGKFVLHDFEGVKTSCMSVNSLVAVDSKDKFLAPLSTHHMGGFSVLARNYFYNSEKPEIMSKWNLDDFIRIIGQHKITITSLVPSQIYEIVQNKIKSPSSLRIAFLGGSAIDDQVYLQAMHLGWPILKTFGSSEACSQIFTQKKSTTTDALSLLSHWHFKVDDDQHLLIKGKSLFKGYLFLKNDDVVFENINLDEDGYFTTEDRVRCTDGSLTEFLGRSNDFIKVNSYLVNVENLRLKFKSFMNEQGLKKQNIILISSEDVKSGFKFVAVTENLDSKIYNIIKKWNKASKSYEAILGLYYINKIPLTEIGKVKYGEINKLLFTRNSE